MTRYFKAPTSSSPPLYHNGTQIYKTLSKAELLARKFEQSHHLTLHMVSHNHSVNLARHGKTFFRKTPLIPPHTPPHTLYKPLRSTAQDFIAQTRCSPGNDGITSIILRHLSQKALFYLTRLFNHFLHTGYFPNAWKHAKVISILKHAKPPTDPTSYKSINLLSVTGNLFERIIANRLTTLANQLHLLPDEQFGFRKKHSTVSQLARIIDYITYGFKLHKHTGMASLDFEKAYDTIWIQGLLYKPISLQLPPYLIYILRAFLVERSFTVQINNASSIPKHPPAGLPQEAVLSTTLFALYISDIPHPPKTHLALYADDTALLVQSWRTDTVARRLLMPWISFTDILQNGNFA